MRAADGGGAVATASRSVIRESADGGLAQRLLDLAAHLREVERRRVDGAGLAPGVEQRVGVEAVAGVGRHAAGRGVRMGQVALALERRELGAHRRRAPLDVGALGDRRRADGLARLEVGVDDQVEDLAAGAR